MIKKLGLLLLLSVALVGTLSQTTYADTLKVQPLLYKEKITGTDRKRGYIDISNSSGQLQNVTVSVKAFRQLDNGKRLEFYDNRQYKEAFVIDRPTFELEARQSIRVFFGVDAKKLPGGDVLAAVMFTTTPPDERAKKGTIYQSVTVGTLVTLISSDDRNHTAEIVKTSVPFFQFGVKLRGSYTLKNTAPLDSSSAFYPVVERSYSPFGKTIKEESRLLSAGVVRTAEYSTSENMFGLYKITVKRGESVKESWVFAILGWGWVVALSIISFFAAIIVMIFKLRNKPTKK